MVGYPSPNLVRPNRRRETRRRWILMTSTSYTVRGMTCNHCAGSVTAEVGRIAGVTDVEVDVSAGRVTVSSEAGVSAGAVAAAVAEAGYEVVDSCCGAGAGASCTAASGADA
jgi:copper chaperone